MSAEIRPILRRNWSVYKLTDQKMQTHKGYQWELGKPRETPGTGELCGPGWLHVYSDPRVAVLLNPQHAAIANPRLFRATAEGVYRSDRSLKAGVSKLTLVEELALPVYTNVELVVFAILATRAIPGRVLIPIWETWADSVLLTGDIDVPASAAAAGAAAGASRLIPIVNQLDQWKAEHNGV